MFERKEQINISYKTIIQISISFPEKLQEAFCVLLCEYINSVVMFKFKQTYLSHICIQLDDYEKIWLGYNESLIFDAITDRTKLKFLIEDLDLDLVL